MSIESGFGTDNQLSYALHETVTSPKKEKNISNTPFNILQLMAIFIGVYFNCEVLKISNLIASSSHVGPTIGLYAYDLLFSILITLPLVKMPEIMGRSFNSYIYFIICNIGGLGFALLGEVPFLKNIVIEKGFWEHLTPAAIGTIVFFALIIVGVAIREIISAYKYRTIKFKMVIIIIF